ncbi:hypothetical protein L599_001000000390 [Luteimonas sp. J16]|jgi:hypothetical protein|nr:hypothetical protein L599_001000000390 [Luteimonas sp. J16]
MAMCTAKKGYTNRFGSVRTRFRLASAMRVPGRHPQAGGHGEA